MSTNDSSKINPAWNGILSKVPEALHSVLIPALAEWDAGVNQRFQELHAQYEPLKAYKNLADNGIDADYAEQAIILADRIQQNPKQIAEQLNQSFNLGFVSPEEAAKLGQGSPAGDPDADFFSDPNADITKHPQFKQLADQISQFQQRFEESNQQQQERDQIEQFESYLDDLESSTKEKNLPFNRRYVTALMTQGLSGEDAVSQYHQDLAIQTVSDPNANDKPEDETPPIVMGGEGSTGGGTPDGSVNFGSLPKNDLNATVAQLLEASLNSGQ